MKVISIIIIFKFYLKIQLKYFNFLFIFKIFINQLKDKKIKF